MYWLFMKSYKLVVAYDGTDYYGWQAQDHKPSVAQALNNAFKHAFNHDIRVQGASRTDAGVHALGQVVRIRTDLAITPDRLKWAWNNVLGPNIVIRSLELVDESFNPFFDVAQKTYFYHFFLERPLPFLQRYGYYYPYKIDMVLLREALQFFIGTHDFCSFKSSEDVRADTVRTIDSINLEYIKRYNVYRITVKGQKFLRHMIRRIVGASFAIASRPGSSIAELKKVMDKRDPRHTLPNAPGKGLLLYKIVYQKDKIK